MSGHKDGDAEIGHTLVPYPEEYTDSQPVLLKEHAECVVFCSPGDANANLGVGDSAEGQEQRTGVEVAELDYGGQLIGLNLNKPRPSFKFN